jgi:DNA-binding NtrC family response regulator
VHEQDKAHPIIPPSALVVEPDKRLLGALGRVLERQGFRVLEASSAPQAREVALRHEPDLALLSLQLEGAESQRLLTHLQQHQPETVCIVLTTAGDAAQAFAALNAGAYDYFETPIQDWDRFGQVLRNAWMVRELRRERDRLRELTALRSTEGLERIIGHSAAIQRVRELLLRVAAIRVPVLVLGESGTGKELVARALHATSPWREEPFVDVNCAAIPAQLLESELFGHERGAFTGADQRKAGLLEVAGEGTIFLDEIGEMPYDLQAKLLRVLGSGSFRRVGGTANIPWRARLVTATNRELSAMVQQGGFREDLLYRLNVVDIRVPPLRDRREDIPLLIWFFIDRFNQAYGRDVKRVSPEALEHLCSAEWRHNNVRQLENAIERAVVLSRGDELGVDLFSDRIPASAPLPGQRSRAPDGPLDPGLLELSYRDAKARVVERFSRAYLEARLAESGGNIAEAARRAGQERPNFRKLMKRFGVPSPAPGRRGD